MQDSQGKSSPITGVTKAIGELIDKVPLYKDAVQPAAKEIGKSLQTVGRVVNALLLPIEGFVWGAEEIRDFVRERVTKKLEHVPIENIQPPKPHIAVPAIDALRYTGAEEELSELYANLLATSMDKMRAYKAHPGFVHMIKTMCPDEARILRLLAQVSDHGLITMTTVHEQLSYVRILARHVSLVGIHAKCEYPALAPSYIDNLVQLGIAEIDRTTTLEDLEYSRIMTHSDTITMIASLNRPTEALRLDKSILRPTNLGNQFIAACVRDEVA